MAEEEKSQETSQDDTKSGDGKDSGGLLTKEVAKDESKSSDLKFEIPDELKKEGIDSLEKLIASRNEMKSKIPVLPESPDKYEIPLPSNLPVNDELMGEFRKAAHQAGLTQDQAKAVVLFWNGFVENQVNVQNQHTKTQIEGLKKEWAGDFDTNLGTARKAIRKFGGDDFVSYLDETGLSNDPRMAKFCLAVGNAMSESSFIDGKNQQPGPSLDELGRPILRSYDKTMKS